MDIEYQRLSRKMDNLLARLDEQQAVFSFCASALQKKLDCLADEIVDECAHLFLGGHNENN